MRFKNIVLFLLFAIGLNGQAFNTSKCDSIDVYYVDYPENGVQFKGWTNAVPHDFPSNIWNGGLDENGLPSYNIGAPPNAPDVDIIINDYTDGGPENHQYFYAVIDTRGLGSIDLFEANSNTGELIRPYVSGSCCTNAVEFLESQTNTLNPRGYGYITTLQEESFYVVAFQLSDFSANGGIQLQYSPTGQNNYVDFPDSQTYVDKPQVKCKKELKCTYQLQEGESFKPFEICDPVFPAIGLGGGGDTNTDDQQLGSTVVSGVTTEITLEDGGSVPILHPVQPDECIQDVRFEKGLLIIEECQDWKIPIENNVKGTRTQILSLRNSSSLIPGCTYSISNYSRGCLAGKVECITIEAVAVNELSMDAHVSTTIDAESWDGRYDITTNRITELNDNLGNSVSGRYGNEVDRFPWGQTSVHSNVIDNADVYIDCTTTQNINSNEWTSRAYTDLRGFAGVFEQNTIESYGRIYMNGVTDVDFRRNEVQSFAYLYFNGSSDILFRQNTFQANSYVRKFNTSTGRWTMYNSVIGRGDIRHYRGTAYNTDLNIESGGRIYQRDAGTQDIRNTSVSDLSYVDLQAASGVTRIWRGSISSLSYFYIRAAVTAGNRYYYSHNQNSSTYDYRSGSANTTLSNNSQTSSGYIRWDNVSGIINLGSNSLNSRAEIRLTGTSGTQNFYYNTLNSYVSGIVVTNATALNIRYNNLTAYGRLTVNGGSPTFNYNNLNSIGIVTLTNYTSNFQRTTVQSDARVNMTGTGNMYGSTFGTSFVFNSTNLAHSYITAMGNINHTAAAANNNRVNIHNQINTLL